MTRLFDLTRTRTALAMSLVAGASLAVAAPVLAQDEDTDAPSSEESKEPMTKGEKRLAKMLEGRVKGEPQNCIRSLPTQQTRTIDKTAYVYGRGKTIYVQRTTRPEQIDDREALVTRRFGGTQLCRQDVARTIDPVTGIFAGAVLFDDFIPYTRVESAEKEDS